MIGLHVSQNLYKRFQLDERGLIRSKTAQDAKQVTLDCSNPLNNWHARIANIQSRNCLILLHEQTQFPLFMLCLTKPDFATFQQHFERSLVATLSAAGANRMQLNVAQTWCQPLCIAANTNQDAQNALDLLLHFLRTEIFVGYLKITKVDAASMAAGLSVLPSFAKGLQQPFMPRQAMLELLSANKHFAQVMAKGLDVVH